MFLLPFCYMFWIFVIVVVFFLAPSLVFLSRVLMAIFSVVFLVQIFGLWLPYVLRYVCVCVCMHVYTHTDCFKMLIS